MFEGSIVWKGVLYAAIMIIAKGLVASAVYFEYMLKLLHRRQRNISHVDEPSLSSAPHSVALLVAFAMVARGEIGFLIASLSQSSGTLTPANEQIFLTIVWAVTICTVVGPVGVGIIVRKMDCDWEHF